MNLEITRNNDMTDVIQEIRDLCASANSEYLFYHEHAHMMNLSLDQLGHDAKVAYLEEIKSGRFGVEPRGFTFKETRVRLSFLQFIELDATAEQKHLVLNDIETNMLLPFMRLYQAKFGRQSFPDFTYVTPPAMFDAHEVSIVVTFNHTETICL